MRLQGFILNADNDQPIPATVTAMHPIQGMVGIENILPGNIWVIDEPEDFIRQLTIVFTAKGFTTQQVSGSTLIDGYNGPQGGNIYMTKATGNTAVIALAALALIVSLKEKKKRVGKVTTQDLLPFLLIAGSILAFNVIKKILDTLGLGGDPSADELANPLSPWKPNYWKQFSTFTYAITESQAKEYAKTIHNAFTLFQDDFNAILGVFSSIKTKANVSYISDIFTRQYNEDLLSFLGDGGGILPWDGLSKEHLATILNLVNRMPKN